MNLPPDHMRSTTNYLYGIKEVYDNEKNFMFLFGFLDTLKVIINPRSVQIKDGSLCKYYLGSNLKGLQRKDVESSLEKISDELHLPFDEAIVTRMDVSSNLIVKNPVGMYFDLLGESTYYTRLEQKSSLYYTKHNSQKVLYDKLKQMKSSNEFIPDHYMNHHVLRYELRYLNRLAKQFQKDQIKAKDLFEESFYIEVIKRWVKEYFDIKKYNPTNFNMRPTGSTKELIDRLALEGLKTIGEDKAMKLIKQWQEGGDINAKQAYHHRQKLEGLLTMDGDQEAHEFILELDQKVLELAEYYK